MESGIDLETFLKKDPDHADRYASDPLASMLELALTKASEMGLLMTDINLRNIVLILDEVNAPIDLKFIDLGADFARLDGADSKCIFFVNAFLFLNYAKCKRGGTAIADITKNIRTNLGQLLKQYQDSTQNELCDILVKMKKDEAHRWASLFVLRDSKSVASGVLAQTLHWNEECGESGWFDASQPLVPQMLKKVEELLYIP